ncbi:hypothetical protein BRC91_05720 [Halobacteriales archaeon QS_4_62_28]|nr:MAG: hypothetical protein BRC91_05720 [Halobacteriales archaeon QS_4_62_28]
MATSVKIDETTKDRLEQLQAAIKLETGRKVTQQKLLDRIIEREFTSKDDLIDSFRDNFEGLSEANVEQWLSGSARSENPVEEADIDRVLYDREAANE